MWSLSIKDIGKLEMPFNCRLTDHQTFLESEDYAEFSNQYLTKNFLYQSANHNQIKFSFLLGWNIIKFYQI